MAITYTWSITGLKKANSLNGYTDVITGIKFEYAGTSDQLDEEGNPYTATFSGAVPASAPPESADDFTSFANLTEAEIITWAQANHPVDHMQQVIQKEINNKINPSNVEVGSMPWGTEEITE